MRDLANSVQRRQVGGIDLLKICHKHRSQTRERLIVASFFVSAGRESQTTTTTAESPRNNNDDGRQVTHNPACIIYSVEMCRDDKGCPGGHGPPSPFASVLESEPTAPSSSTSTSTTDSSASASSSSPQFIVYRYKDGTSECLPAINIPAFVFYEPLYERPKRFNKKALRKKWDEAEFKRWKTALEKAREAAKAEIAAGAEPAPGTLASGSPGPGSASLTEEAAGPPPSEEGGASSATPSPLAGPAPASARATEADPVVVPQLAPRTRGGETDVGVPSATPSPQAPLASTLRKI